MALVYSRERVIYPLPPKKEVVTQVENYCFRGRFTFVLMKDFRNVAGTLIPTGVISC